jgi:hypothetical protein
VREKNMPIRTPAPGDPAWEPSAEIAAEMRHMIAAAEMLPEYTRRLDEERQRAFYLEQELQSKTIRIAELEGTMLELQRECARLQPFEQAHQAALTFLAESKAIQKKFSADVVAADASRRLRKAGGPVAEVDLA